MERIAGAGAKKGCLLVQFPGSIKPVLMHELEQLLMQIRLSDPENTWKVAVEFRHQSWYQEDTYEMLDSLDMGLVLHDKLQEGAAFIDSATDFVYVTVPWTRAEITAAAMMTSFYLNMPPILKNGWQRANRFIPISTTPWEVQSRTWKP